MEYLCFFISSFWKTHLVRLTASYLPGRVHVHVAQSDACLATNVCLIADPGVASLIPARSQTFVEIDHESYMH